MRRAEWERLVRKRKWRQKTRRTDEFFVTVGFLCDLFDRGRACGRDDVEDVQLQQSEAGCHCKALFGQSSVDRRKTVKASFTYCSELIHHAFDRILDLPDHLLRLQDKV